MMNSGQPLDRRTVLRGLGTVLALPLLEAMQPRRAAGADLAPAAADLLHAQRHPHGPLHAAEGRR